MREFCGIGDSVMRLLVPSLLPAILAASTAVAEQKWPQFRGPRGDGTSLAKDVPPNWSDTNNLASKVPVPGRGHYSPIVLEGRLWLTAALEPGGKHNCT